MTRRCARLAPLAAAVAGLLLVGCADDADEEQAVEEAQQLLGVPEDEIEEDERTRIMRRGDEQLAGTMDLRPGRRNLELDDDGTGTYVVTRVVIEMDGDDIVVE